MVQIFKFCLNKSTVQSYCIFHFGWKYSLLNPKQRILFQLNRSSVQLYKTLQLELKRVVDLSHRLDYIYSSKISERKLLRFNLNKHRTITDNGEGSELFVFFPTQTHIWRNNIQLHKYIIRNINITYFSCSKIYFLIHYFRNFNLSSIFVIVNA